MKLINKIRAAMGVALFMMTCSSGLFAAGSVVVYKS
jgi:hypothetical protein